MSRSGLFIRTRSLTCVLCAEIMNGLCIQLGSTLCTYFTDSKPGCFTAGYTDWLCFQWVMSATALLKELQPHHGFDIHCSPPSGCHVLNTSFHRLLLLRVTALQPQLAFCMHSLGGQVQITQGQYASSNGHSCSLASPQSQTSTLQLQLSIPPENTTAAAYPQLQMPNPRLGCHSSSLKFLLAADYILHPSTATLHLCIASLHPYTAAPHPCSATPHPCTATLHPCTATPRPCSATSYSQTSSDQSVA